MGHRVKILLLQRKLLLLRKQAHQILPSQVEMLSATSPQSVGITHHIRVAPRQVRLHLFGNSVLGLQFLTQLGGEGLLVPQILSPSFTHKETKNDHP